MIRQVKNRFILYGATKIMDYLTYPEEKRIGVQPEWNSVNLPSNWIQRPVKTSLDQAKRIMHHDNQCWFGHFFLAGYDQESAIERFNPNSPYYQAWVGIYLLNSSQNNLLGFSDETFDLEELSTIGIGDQTSWLKTYRIKKPIVQVTHSHVLKNPHMYHSKAKFAFLGEMRTQSDLNPKGANDWRYNQLFGIPNKKEWFNLVEPHHELLLRGYYVVWSIDDLKTTIIIYGALVAEMETKNGTIISYWEEKEQELRNIIASISFKYL